MKRKRKKKSLRPPTRSSENKRWWLACQEGFTWDEVNEIV